MLKKHCTFISVDLIPDCYICLFLVPTWNISNRCESQVARFCDSTQDPVFSRYQGLIQGGSGSLGRKPWRGHALPATWLWLEHHPPGIIKVLASLHLGFLPC